MTIVETVQARWRRLALGLGVTSAEWINAQWRQMAAAYGEGWRKYHDLGHIAYGLDMFDEYAELAGDPLALAYAWMRHDERYITYERPRGLPSPEALSADIADESLRELNELGLVVRPITLEFRQAVTGLINATHHHEDFPPQTQDEMLLKDIDWSPMAAPWPEFLRHRKNIRAEYGRYSDKAFAVGRAGFICKLRGRESYFCLPAFKERFDAQAKENIAREVELMELPWEEQAAIMAAA